MIDAADLEAATQAFLEEEQHWRKLPRHHPGRPFVAERHSLRHTEMRPFANGAKAVDTTFESFTDETKEARETRITRACVLKAIEATQRKEDAA